MFFDLCYKYIHSFQSFFPTTYHTHHQKVMAIYKITTLINQIDLDPSEISMIDFIQLKESQCALFEHLILLKRILLLGFFVSSIQIINLILNPSIIVFFSLSFLIFSLFFSSYHYACAHIEYTYTLKLTDMLKKKTFL